MNNFKNYRFNPRQAAEKLWGTGGTKAYPTNRKGAYYYSCSGHGGYVVKAEALTEKEREALKRYTRTECLKVLVDLDTREVYGTDWQSIARSFRRLSNKGFRVPLGARVAWENYEFYVFEEDCDWAILEKFTSVRCPGRTNWSEKEMEEHTEDKFNWLLKFWREQEDRERKEKSGAYLLTAALNSGEKVHALFRNKHGEQKGALIESSEAYDRVRTEIKNPTYEDYEREGVVFSSAPAEFYS